MIMETTRQATREELAQRVDELQEKLEKKDKDLETWKKIAEKLAEKCNMTKRATKIDSDNDWCNGTVYMTTEEKLDWAKKEVENEPI